jgi:hypothetical protein
MCRGLEMATLVIGHSLPQKLGIGWLSWPHLRLIY